VPVTVCNHIDAEYAIIRPANARKRGTLMSALTSSSHTFLYPAIIAIANLSESISWIDTHIWCFTITQDTSADQTDATMLA
jgi:hypothetical protein